MKTTVKASIVGALCTIGISIVKFKSALLAILKGGWILQASLSLLLSLWSYAVLFTWEFALLMVSMLFVHEGGHWLAMRIAGLNPKAPIFVPLLGAYVEMTKMPGDKYVHAWVAYAGPFTGGVFSLAVYGIGLACNSTALMAGGVFGSILNLMQLIPAWPLDGNFITDALSKWLMIPGTILLAILAIKLQNVVLLILVVMSTLVIVVKFFLMGKMFQVEILQGAKATTIREQELALTAKELTATIDSRKSNHHLWQKTSIALAYLSLSAVLGFGSAFEMHQVAERLKAEGKELPATIEPMKGLFQ